jgi:hypothetical protein
VILLGLAVRPDVVWRHNEWQATSAAWLVGDEPGYNNMALEFLQGYGFTWPGRVPLYPALLAGLHWLTFSSSHAIRYLQCALSADGWATPTPIGVIRGCSTMMPSGGSGSSRLRGS